jgi:dTDP-4-dehydrorhamnose reductase
MERNGHARRLGDLAMFAALGIRAIRYPVLWERVAKRGLEAIDWSWADERLVRLRELDISQSSDARIMAGAARLLRLETCW